MNRNSALTISILFFSVLSLLVRCATKNETLFKLRDADDTGIHFLNEIIESDSFNILTYEYIYNGGGVGIADFNNDGLQDIFFSGNQVPNALYLNQGSFAFKDITSKANVNVPGRWNQGVAIVDINNDGWMDVYVCATASPDSAKRKNMLFENQGLDASGEPVFREKAGDYNIDFDGHSVMAAFLDYDRDGDLDLYILVNQKLEGVPTNYRPKIIDGSAANNDKLFRNDGNNTFSDVTMEAGITLEGYGLGLAIADVNLDGWPDIYVSNDYLSTDVLYVNNKNGTFTNVSAEFLGHQSQFSMGNDAADINNDGLPDLITLDMLPETNGRKKTTISGKSYSTYINNEQYGYEYQYVRNMVYLNNGLNQGIKFSEIGQLSGLYQTEWSWSPLFADFDNDGNKDVLITNGFPKDITDKDFAIYRAEVANLASNSLLIDSIPVIKIPNYAFRNNGDLTFSDVTKLWVMEQPSFSNGSEFADFDNDGDLDYVVNNINDKAFVYENRLNGSGEVALGNNFLRIKLKGSDNNRQGLGTKITLCFDSGRVQYYEQTIYRGFLSSVDEICHFGLGKVLSIDSIRVEWPDGSIERFKDFTSNQKLTIEYKASKRSEPDGRTESTPFEEVGARYNILFKHEEDDKIDFNLQRTLPHKFSQAGPGLSVGDINNDGLEDFIIGGSTSHTPTVFLQKKDGTFSMVEKNSKDEKKTQEDEGMLLFDADGDEDLDLYIVSGSIESQQIDVFQDRLYMNNGTGNFSLSLTALPDTRSSGSCVRAADYDQDGDLDLFVGGRVVPASYPYPAKSYLLQNEKGKFTDVTQKICSELDTLGMVTDALWSDFNNDGKVDLIVLGEFMPITFFVNEGGKFIRLSSTGIEHLTGWWNSLSAGDFDNDGDIDYVAGNLGLNNNFQVKINLPLKVFAKDFDGNGSVDPLLACYMRESMETDVKKLYPVHFWDELNSQSPKFRNKYSRYKQYSKATIDQVLTSEDLKDALILEANHMASSYIKNLGGGKFSMAPLPTLAQVAPINGLVTTDVNEDGNPDVMLVGNDYGNEVFAGRYDALTGLVLLGNGRGSFNVVSSAQSNFYVSGDAKALVKLYTVDGDELFIASRNRDSLNAFLRIPAPPEVLTIQAMESWAQIIFSDGRKQRIEFYYGSGYLSQSSRRLSIPKGAKEIIIYDYKGNSRKIQCVKV